MIFYILIFLSTICAFVYFKFIKPGTFKISNVIPFFILFGILIFLDISHRINNNKFYEKSFHSLVVDCKNYGKEANANFLLKNDLYIYSMVGDLDVKLGDSIIKESNTYKYKVYRKNEYGKYNYKHQYQYVP